MPEENLAYSNSKRPQIQDVDEIQSHASIEPDVSLIDSESMRDGFPILTHLQEQRKGRLSAHDPHGRSPSPCSTSSNDDGKGTEVVYDTLSSTSPAKQQPQAPSAHSLLSLKSRKSVLCLGASIPFHDIRLCNVLTFCNRRRRCTVSYNAVDFERFDGKTGPGARSAKPAAL
jgi:hypothetical protein